MLHNLRPSSDSPGLMPALPPQTMPCPEGWKPLCGFSIDDTDYLLIAKDSAVAVLTNPAVVANPLVLDGPVVSAVTLGPTIVISTSTDIYEVAVDPDTLALSVLPDFSTMPPAVRAVDAGFVYTTPPAVMLGADAESGLLKASERRRLAEAAKEAWINLDDAVAAAGVLWQPVAVAVRILSADGAVLYTSSPVVLTHPDGKQFNPSFAFSRRDSSLFAVAPEVAAPVWRPMVTLPPALLESLPAGAVIQLVMSPLIYGSSTSRTPAVAPRRRSDDPLARVTLAAAVPDVVSAKARMSPVWSTRLPDSSMTFPVVPPGVGALSVDPPAMTLLSAGAGAATASTVVFAAPSMRRADPPSPAGYAAAVDAGSSWRGYVEVEFADGSSRVTVAEGPSDAPVSFSPLLSYPAPDAVALTVVVRSQGVVRRRRFPLVASAKSAVFIASDLKPLTLDSSLPVYVPPASRPSPVDYPACVAVADSSLPLQPYAILAPSAGKVNAVCPAVSAQSSWDFGRSRFYVFTDSGIYMLNVDPARRKASLSLIDTRVVESRAAVCRVDGSVAAIASGDILLLAGSHLSRIARVPSAVALAWNHADHELWCLTPDDVNVVCFDHNFTSYIIPTAFSSSPVQISPDVTLLGAAPMCLCNHSRIVPAVDILYDEVLPVEPSSTPRASKSLPPICTLTVDSPGSYESLTVSASRVNATCEPPAPDFTATVRGDIVEPLRFRFFLPPTARSLRVTLSGKASPASRLKSLALSSPHNLNF